MIEKIYLSTFNACTNAASRRGGVNAMLAFATACFCGMQAFAQTSPNCLPNSPLPCDSVQMQLPVRLTFDASMPNSILDGNGAGTGFRLVENYSGARDVTDGVAPNAGFKPHMPSKLLVADGRLRITTSKGIAYLDVNNQINTLGVKIDTDKKLEIKADIINPFYGTQDEQAGIWFGMNDQNYFKLVITKNKVEFRREINDFSTKTPGPTNPDHRATGTISGLNSKTVTLKMVVDPGTMTVGAFYSVNGGATFVNVGAGFTVPTLSMQGMTLAPGSANAGVLATHRNGTTAVTYLFDNFEVYRLLDFETDNPVFTVSDAAEPGTQIGSVRSVSGGASPASYQLSAGNTNGAFAIDAATGVISVRKRLNYHTQSQFNIRVIGSAGTASDTTMATINVTIGPGANWFSNVAWSTAAPQPYRVSEAQGEVVNGKLYSFGGFDIEKTKFSPTLRSYVYDPVANQWTRIADLPHTPKGTTYGGVTHAGFTTDGTDIYMAGGYVSNSSGTGQTFGVQQVWKYNVASNTYSKMPDLPIRIAAGQLEYMAGKLYHISGTNAARTQDLGNHYVLDLDNLAAGWKTLAPLPNPRQHAGSVVYNGKIYYIGGQTGHDNTLVTKKDVHCYDPTTNVWSKLADLPAPGTFGLGHIACSVVLVGDRLIVLGGETKHGTSVNLVSAYSPALNQWESLTPMPGVRYSGVAAYMNGALYYTGGSKTNTTYKGTIASSGARQSAVAEEAQTLNESKVIVFPNPVTSGNVSFLIENFDSNEPVKLTVLNAFGKPVFTTICTTDTYGNGQAILTGHQPISNHTYVIQAEGQRKSAMGRMISP